MSYLVISFFFKIILEPCNEFLASIIDEAFKIRLLGLSFFLLKGKILIDNSLLSKQMAKLRLKGNRSYVRTTFKTFLDGPSNAVNLFLFKHILILGCVYERLF